LQRFLSMWPNNLFLKDNYRRIAFFGFGRIVANTIFMILVTMQMEVLADKRKELSQTIALLIGSIKREKGCRRCDFCRSMENENRFFLFEEWDTREDFDLHLKSACFTVFRGTLNLLQKPCEMVFHTVTDGKSCNEWN